MWAFPQPWDSQLLAGQLLPSLQAASGPVGIHRGTPECKTHFSLQEQLELDLVYENR